MDDAIWKERALAAWSFPSRHSSAMKKNPAPL